jgi:LysR family transcriptional regulator, chromosome initiation inhibitor
VDLNPGQLDALVAIAEHGSFDAAARLLHITPSAVSQRIRALESAAGQVLVSRGTPCRPTPQGAALVRLGRQTRFLYDEAAQALEDSTVVELPVAVNADSLAAWFRDVLAEAAAWPGTALRLRVEDQGYSQELLRRGDVLAAVTSDPAVVQGCSVDPLGALRYLPAAAPSLTERALTERTRASRLLAGQSPAGPSPAGPSPAGRAPAGPGQQDGALDWAGLPVVVFNDKDDLQYDLLRRHGVTSRPAVVHQIPATADFHEAVRLGLGWGMIPEPQARPELAAGSLVLLSDDVIDVPLYWQRWRLDSPRLASLTAAARQAAVRHLRPPGSA